MLQLENYKRDTMDFIATFLYMWVTIFADSVIEEIMRFIHSMHTIPSGRSAVAISDLPRPASGCCLQFDNDATRF